MREIPCQFQPKDAPKIVDKSLWFKGPDGKYYATADGLNNAWEQMYRKNPYKQEHQLKNNLNEKERFRTDIRPKELAKRIIQLAGLTPEEIQVLEDFLRSLNQHNLPSQTSSPIAPDKK